MYEPLYDVWLFRGKVVNPSPKDSPPGRRGPRKQTPPKNLLDRLERYKQEMLAFLRDFRVPFDNSLAERDIPMMKVKQRSQDASAPGKALRSSVRSAATSRRHESRDTGYSASFTMPWPGSPSYLSARDRLSSYDPGVVRLPETRQAVSA